LRRAPLWAISGSFVHPFSMPSVFLGSIDMVEQDQISLYPFFHCYDVHLNILTKIRKPHPLRQRPGDIGEIVELHYHFGVLWFVVLHAYVQICIFLNGCYVSSFISSSFIKFLNGKITHA
jgi:hypothetical protein